MLKSEPFPKNFRDFKFLLIRVPASYSKLGIGISVPDCNSTGTWRRIIHLFQYQVYKHAKLNLRFTMSHCVASWTQGQI